MILLSRWSIPCTATTPSSSGCIIHKLRRPASLLAQEGRDEIKDLHMTTVNNTHSNNVSVCQNFSVVFLIKQFSLPIITNYNFYKNCNFQRAVTKFLKLQQSEVRITPIKAASQSFSLVPFLFWSGLFDKQLTYVECRHTCMAYTEATRERSEGNTELIYMANLTQGLLALPNW